MIGSPRTIRPEEPKADQTIAGSYESPTQKVEIDAICSYAEGIRCWNMQGAKNDEAEAKINQAIAKSAENEYSGGTQATIRLGMKNRMVVIKTTDYRGNRDGSQPRTYVHVQGGGSSPQYSGHANINLEQPQNNFDSPEHFRYEVRLLSEKQEASSTTLRLAQTEQLPDFGTIELKIGSKAQFAGYSLTVASIKPGSPREMYGGGQGQKTWTVVIKHSGTPSREANLHFIVVGDDGNPIQFADAAGNPVSQAKYQEHMQKMMNSQEASSRAMPFRHAQGGSMKQGNETQVMLQVNPARIKSLRIQGNFNRIIDVTGIPMDPK